jgi:hypothetical protein
MLERTRSNKLLTLRGFEPVSSNPINPGLSHLPPLQGAADSGALVADSDLWRVVEAWDRIDPALKAGIMAIVAVVESKPD